MDAGDLLQGDPFAAYFAQVAPQDLNPIVDVMNQLAYDAATPGNHDFNFGVAAMHAALRRASFRVVSANLFDLPAETPTFSTQTVLVRKGIRVGITGFTTPGVMVWDRNNVKGQMLVQRIGSVAPGKSPGSGRSPISPLRWCTAGWMARAPTTHWVWGRRTWPRAWPACRSAPISWWSGIPTAKCATRC